MKNPTQRRSFLSALSKVFLSTGLATVSEEVMAEEPKEMVKLLSPDGELIEVDKAILEKSRNNKPSSNKSILKWTNQIKTD